MFLKKSVIFLFLILGLFSGCILDQTGPLRITDGTISEDEPFELKIPSNYPIMDIPADNPLTKQGVALGRMLFYDPILSGDSTQSCSSCHAQAFGFSDHRKKFSLGIDGLEGDMNAMQIINVGYMTRLFWDGRAEGVEAQAFQPVINPIEMHEDWENAVAKLNRHRDYPRLFRQVFGTDEISSDLATKAIAQFERTMIAGNSKYDKFSRFEFPEGVFTEQERRGYEIFFTEKGDCFHCHTVDILTDNKFHNNGLDNVFTDYNLGYFKVTGDPSDIGKFKVPTLINIEHTGPYMHDSRFQTLEEVVEFYNSQVKVSPTVDPIMTKPGKEFGLLLTADDKAALVAFLKTLTDNDFINNPDFSSPFD